MALTAPSSTTPLTKPQIEHSDPSGDSIPWYGWTSALTAAAAALGLVWDVSWHMSIGRDTFWTPAHIVIQFSALLAGASSVLLIASAHRHQTGVRVFGLNGPLGAFVSLWGGAAMLISAPFDNWWHVTYGIDVKILSPPHALLATGLLAVVVGNLLLVIRTSNRAGPRGQRKLRCLVLFIGGMMVTQNAVWTYETSTRAWMHNSTFFEFVAVGFPVVLVAIAVVSRQRWAMSVVGAIYTFFWLSALWLFPLFPAQPRLGPVYQDVRQMVPPGFPIMLVIPAAALDLLWPWMERRSVGTRALVLGVVFLTIFFVVQWPLADFLMSDAARNRFFGSDYLPYFVSPLHPLARDEFILDPSFRSFLGGMAMAMVWSVLSSRAGLALGEWMREVRR